MSPELSIDERFRRLSRGLPFRLTLSYALFFTLMLAVVGLLFRGALATRLDANLRDVLDQEWAAMKGFLHIEAGHGDWVYDREDPDESAIVGRLRRVYILANPQGKVLEGSELYSSIGIDSPAEIQALITRSAKTPAEAVWKVKRAPSGQDYLVRAGAVFANDRVHDPYYVAIGRSLADNERVLDQFTRLYLFAMPFVIFAGCWLGWLLSNRALEPVTKVAWAAQRISSSNLSLRLPERGAHDQLDTLIATFNEMIARLENSFSQVREFSANVSHELRTPLTAVRGQLEVALFTAKSAEEYREAIVGSLDDIERLSQIIRALLQLAQAESGQVVLQRATQDLAVLVPEVLEQFEITAEEAGVAVEWSAPGPVEAEVDRVQFERLVSNLVSNGVKFTPRGGTVRVTLEAKPGRADLIVEDTGRGIPAEHLPHIFDRFYRVPGGAGGPERGLGLGLSFVYWIARAHGGTVRAESEPGRGTRFIVSLPAEAPKAIEPPTVEAMNQL